MNRDSQGGLRQQSSTSFLFGGWLGASVAVYAGLIALLLIADLAFVLSSVEDFSEITDLLTSVEILSSVQLTLMSCTVSTLLALLIAIPSAYALSRFPFRGRAIVDSLIDIPLVLPPLVVGVSLLIFFNAFPSAQSEESVEGWLNDFGIGITNTKWAIILAQFTVSTAFAIRMVKATFDQLNKRNESVAMTLGASRGRAFFHVVLPQSRQGILAAGTLAWAKSLGEFGPILVFAGATRGKTEVLSTSVYLELNTGNIVGAVAISLLMICVALAVVLVVRYLSKINI